MGAALTYRQMYADDVVLRVATVTKLTRNLCLAGVIPLLAWMHLRASRGTGARHVTTNWTTLGAVVCARLRRDGNGPDDR